MLILTMHEFAFVMYRDKLRYIVCLTYVRIKLSFQAFFQVNFLFLKISSISAISPLCPSHFFKAKESSKGSLANQRDLLS